MATTGVKYPSTISWPGATAPDSARLSDAAQGTVTIGGVETMVSTWGYALNIPADATNIKIILHLQGSVTAGSFYSYHFARNVDTGSPVSVGSTSVVPGATEAVQVVSNAVWDQKSGPAAWTPADLNNTFFGWQLSFGGNTASNTLNINSVGMEVTYDLPGGTTPKWWWNGWGV